MAAALMRQALDARGHSTVTVASAGSGAWEGAPASEGALLVALENGLDLSSHRARLLTREVVRSADLIFTMAAQHRERAVSLGAGDRAHVLGEYARRPPGQTEVHDPFGSDLDSYRVTFGELESLVSAVAARIAAGRPSEQR